MTHQIFNLPPQQPLSAAGRVLPGAKAYFFLTESDTPTPVYTTSELSTTHAVPVVADAGGRFESIYLDPAITYKCTITDANDVLLYTIDPCNDVLLSAAIIGGYLYPKTTAETTADVDVVDYTYPPGCINRYGENTSPGVTEMDTALNAAFDQRYEGGANPYGLKQVYKLTEPFELSTTAEDVHFYCDPGGQLLIGHNGDGIVYVVANENSEGNSIENWHILGPNTLLPPDPYTPPSNGAGICMNRNVSHTTGDLTNVGTEMNEPTQYNGFIRNVRVEGFDKGINMQSVIGLNVFGCVFQYNQHGIYIDGGQCNANKFWGTHVRYNRVRGITSSGRTGGALTGASANDFFGCLIESNIPYPFVSGGTPPDDSTAIYLNNSYDFNFYGCYSENHAAAVYLAGQSKGHRFIAHRLAFGDSGSRLDKIILSGAGVYNNVFDLKGNTETLTDVMIESDNADQLYNEIMGDGINIITGSISAPIHFANIRPDPFLGSRGVGLIRRPAWGYKDNVAEGTNPGEIDGIGTATAELNVLGLGEIRFGNGITGHTTITSIIGAQPGQLLTLVGQQSTYNVVLDSTALSGSLVCLNGLDANLGAQGRVITFLCTGAGNLIEQGRSWIETAGAYTVSNPAAADRTIDVTADTLQQTKDFLGTLVNDLKARGYLT